MAVPGETREKEGDKEMACKRGGEMGHHSSSSRPWYRHQPLVYGPLYLLWVAVLAVATGPATCFVVPSSRLRACCGFFATASLPPKVVVGNQALRGQRSPMDERSSSLRQTVYAVIKHGGDDVGRGVHGTRQGLHQRQGGSSAKTDRRTGSGGSHSISPQSGTRTGDQALHASLPGLDVESKVSSAASDTKRVLILMSDTGGGHRASSEALSAALKDLYGDQIQADIVDIWTTYGRFPFSSAVNTYKFLGKHPRLWKLSYEMARFPPTRRWAELLANLSCHRSFRECFEKYDPDLVVSTHPLCHHVPHKVLRRMRKDSGKYIPFVTVVTDLGSAHPTWFDPRGDLVYVPSDVLRRRAAARGIPQHKLLQFGLPVRHAFWDEPMEKGTVREKLRLRPGVRTALIVGGGDGVGKLQDIATQVAEQLVADRHEGQVVVVCGKNEKMKQALEEYSWPNEKTGVTVRVLGFVTNMDEWMSASDLLVTKAGPGTIAEACTRGLPLILSSFLPGQEAGNVPYVTENEFGLYHKRPADIARVVSDLLADHEKLEMMGAHARALGRPRASLDIARSIVSNLMPETIEVPGMPLPSP